MLSEKIGVIGAGKIGSALVRGIVRAGVVDKTRIIASAPRPEARAALAAETGVLTTAANPEVCAFADIVILAVKPQVLDAVLREIADSVSPDKLAVSVAAGATIQRIEDRLTSGGRVIRVMTNTPCVIGAAASCYSKGSRATEEDMKKVGLILSSVGLALPLEERFLDAVTGLSGSGPAYLFLFIEALTDGGVQAGLPRDVALKLALQTVYGSAKLAMESGKHLAQLKDEVTSPGGTTIAGVYALEQKGFRGTVMDAVAGATRRSQELGKGR